MSFVSFLKTFGLDALKGAQVLAGIAPIAGAVVGATNAYAGTLIDKFDAMLTSGLSIEASFAAAFGPNAKTGPAKLAALIPQIQNIVTQSTVLTGKSVKDPALFTKALQGGAQFVIDLMNSVEGSAQVPDNVKNVPALPPSGLTLDITPISVSTTTKAPTPALATS